MLGVAVLAVAIVALRNPKEASNVAGTDTRVSTPPASVSIPPASGSGSTSSSRTKSGSPSPSRTKVSAVGSEPLIVLNDTTTPNLAKDAANRFEGAGWNITTFDENFSNTISSTVAYYDPSVAGAQRAAQALQRQFPAIKRIAPRFAPAQGGDPLPAGPVVVVLTDDYSPG